MIDGLKEGIEVCGKAVGRLVGLLECGGVVGFVLMVGLVVEEKVPGLDVGLFAMEGFCDSRLGLAVG